MKAFIFDRYGKRGVARIRDVPEPEEVVIRVI
jgi:hypothetical protein